MQRLKFKGITEISDTLNHPVLNCPCNIDHLACFCVSFHMMNVEQNANLFSQGLALKMYIGSC